MPPMIEMTSSKILQEIRSVFPVFPLPPIDEMLEFAGDTIGSNFIRELDECRFKDVDDAIIRSSRMELYFLCPNAIKWILPHYLVYCITKENRLTEEFVEFLLYYFNPKPADTKDRLQRISAISKEQLDLLIEFFKLKLNSSTWLELMDKEFNNAITFCRLAIETLETR